MPKKSKIPRSETVAFVAAHLKKDANIAMSKLKELGQAAGHNVYGLIVGLARNSLGMKKRGPGRPPGKRGPGRPPGKRGPGRPPGKRGPGRPPGKRGPGRPPGSGRGPGRPPGRRGPGRPRGSSDFSAGLAGIAGHMRDLEREVASLRTALGKIADVASGA